MPTEEQFEEAGARFETAADEADELLRPVRQANRRRPLHGGELTRDVDAFVDESGVVVSGMAGDLRDLARESRRRAEECRQAKQAQAAHEAAQAQFVQDSREHLLKVMEAGADPALPGPGDPPVRPDPPPTTPPYVEI